MGWQGGCASLLVFLIVYVDNHMEIIRMILLTIIPAIIKIVCTLDFEFCEPGKCEPSPLEVINSTKGLNLSLTALLAYFRQIKVCDHLHRCSGRLFLSAPDMLHFLKKFISRHRFLLISESF